MDPSGVTTPESLDGLPPRKPLPRRRNGQEQACEPCRKSKQKCDHGLPTCLKCARRKNPSKCVYLPAPMSQAKTLRTSERRTESIPPTSPQALISPQPSVSVAEAVPSPLYASGFEEPAAPLRPGPPDHTSGFLSSTSFAAIVKENFVGTLEIADKTNEIDMTSEQATGVRILRLLPSRETCKALMDIYFESLECVFHPFATVHIENSIWNTFGQYFQEPRHLGGMELVVQEIMRNSSKPLLEPDDYHEWRDAFSGRNLRWEALGIVLVSMAYFCFCSPGNAQTSTTKPMKSLALELKGAVEMIIGILRKNETTNLLVVALLTKNFHLGTMIYGDTSFRVWRELGELVGALTALNLHQDDGSSNSPETVTISQQIRRRVFGMVFIHDKMLALFNGRPPMLSARYCSCPPPLDLPEDAFIHGKEHLMQEVQALDEDGWSRKTESDVSCMTSARATVAFCMILDEILEMLIGNRAQWSEQRLKTLETHLDKTYSAFPSHLHFLRADIHPLSQTPSPRSDRLHWEALCSRLEYLRMTFLMERLWIERTALASSPQCRQKLLDISRNMLENTVYLWLQRDRFSTKVHDYDYMLMCYGMPSAGILCVELLKSLKHTTKVNEDSAGVRLPRSEVVQNLSLLVGFLDWVRPSAGNYKLCGRMRQIIQRILDMVLDPSPAQGHDSAESSKGAEQQSGFLQPDRRSDELSTPLVNGPELESQNSESIYGASAPGISKGYAGAGQTQMGPTGMGFGYGGVGSMGFGMGMGMAAGNVGGGGMMGDGFEGILDAGLENLDWLDTVDWTRGPWIDLN